MQTRKIERELCLDCLRPTIGCYCDFVTPFDPGVKFLFLTHLREWRHPMGSARMASRFLQGSKQLRVDSTPFSVELREQIHKPNTYLLYPAEDAIEVSSIPFPSSQLIILDGTWSTAKTMLKEHPHLEKLPKIVIHPKAPSLFRVRKQLKNFCLSSLEAAHSILQSFPLSSDQRKATHKMIEAFEWMNHNQIEQAKRKPLFCHWWSGRKTLFSGARGQSLSQ